MSDWSLCATPDRLECCAHCVRNPSVHPYALNEFAQSWMDPLPLVDGKCRYYVEGEKCS